MTNYRRRLAGLVIAVAAVLALAGHRRFATARIIGTNPIGASADPWCIGGRIRGNTTVSSTEVCVDSSGNLIPTTTATGSLGTSSLKWSSVNTSGAASIGGSATITGNLSVTGTSALTGAVTVGSGSTVTVTGALVSVSSSSTSNLPFSLDGMYTTAQLQAKTPTAAGQLVYNVTLANVCVSTGATVQGYKLVGTASTTCQ